MNVINLTPHPIELFRDGQCVQTVPISGKIARVTSTEVVVGEVLDFPVVQSQWGKIENLPEPEPDTIYIVSLLVLNLCRDRSDVVGPDTGKGAVRDAEGRIIGTTRFQKVE